MRPAACADMCFSAVRFGFGAGVVAVVSSCAGAALRVPNPPRPLLADDGGGR
jgi:hypothetical protein